MTSLFDRAKGALFGSSAPSLPSFPAFTPPPPAMRSGLGIKTPLTAIEATLAILSGEKDKHVLRKGLRQSVFDLALLSDKSGDAPAGERLRLGRIFKSALNDYLKVLSDHLPILFVEETKEDMDTLFNITHLFAKNTENKNLLFAGSTPNVRSLIEALPQTDVRKNKLIEHLTAILSYNRYKRAGQTEEKGTDLAALLEKHSWLRG